VSTTASVLALCEHLHYVSGCDRCEIRRMAAVDFLLGLLDETEAALDGAP